jgi:hypothetical protein
LKGIDLCYCATNGQALLAFTNIFTDFYWRVKMSAEPLLTDIRWIRHQRDVEKNIKGSGLLWSYISLPWKRSYSCQQLFSTEKIFVKFGHLLGLFENLPGYFAVCMGFHNFDFTLSANEKTNVNDRISCLNCCKKNLSSYGAKAARNLWREGGYHIFSMLHGI